MKPNFSFGKQLSDVKMFTNSTWVRAACLSFLIMNKTAVVKKQNLENFYPRCKRTGHYKIFSFGAVFAVFMEPTQQAAGNSASQNKFIGRRFAKLYLKLKEKPGKVNTDPGLCCEGLKYQAMVREQQSCQSGYQPPLYQSCLPVNQHHQC